MSDRSGNMLGVKSYCKFQSFLRNDTYCWGGALFAPSKPVQAQSSWHTPEAEGENSSPSRLGLCQWQCCCRSHVGKPYWQSNEESCWQATAQLGGPRRCHPEDLSPKLLLGRTHREEPRTAQDGLWSPPIWKLLCMAVRPVWDISCTASVNVLFDAFWVHSVSKPSLSGNIQHTRCGLFSWQLL